MRTSLKDVEKVGTYPALARWAERWQVVFRGTASYQECLRQAWEAVERREEKK
jgi:hypothetical protein